MRAMVIKSLTLPLRVIDQWWRGWEEAYEAVMKEIKEESEDSKGNK